MYSISESPSVSDLRFSTKAPSFGENSRRDIPGSFLTLDDMLDRWLERKSGLIKPSSLCAYGVIVEKHLRPALGAVTLQRLDDGIVAEYVCALGAGSCPLAGSTARGITNVLRSVLELCREYGCGVTPSKCVCRKKTGRPEICVFTDDEQEKLLGALGPCPRGCDLGILICLKTGLRLGEICALKWGDISFCAGLLTVERTVLRISGSRQQAGGTQLHFGDPKSQSSRRSIPLSPLLMDVLKLQRQDDHCFVVSNRSERTVEPRSMQRHFKLVLRRAGLRSVNFHVLRHTFATSCVDKGFDVKSLSMILGHANVSTTMNTYVHPSMERIRSMMSLLD